MHFEADLEGPVRKIHLKREDALASLKASTKKQFETNAEMIVLNENLPKSFIQFLNSEKSKTNNLLILGQILSSDFIKTALKQTDVETLVMVKKVMTPNRQKRGEKNLTNLEKIEKVLKFLYPQIATLEKCTTRLCNLQRC